MSDIRFGRPSCSEFSRLDACPASYKMGIEARRRGVAPPGNEHAASGDRIHAALKNAWRMGADGEWDALSLSESDMAYRCYGQAKRLIADWSGDEDWSENPRYQIFAEQRLGMTRLSAVIDVTPHTKAKLLFTGQYDLLVFDTVHGKGIELDYKSLMGDVREADGNRQLMGLAALTMQRHGIGELRVGIVQPWCGQPSVADYTPESFLSAKAWTMDLMERVEEPSQPLPGDHCRYCPAQLICPAFTAIPTQALSTVTVPALPEGKEKEAMYARLHEMTGDDLAELKARMKQIHWLEASLDSVIKKKLEDDPLAVPGWELKEKEGRRSVSDAGKAYALSGLTPEQFLPCCTVSLPDLEEALRIASGPKLNKDGSPAKRGYVLSAEQAKERVNTTLAGVINRKKTVVLQEVGAAIEEETPTPKHEG